MKYSEHKKRKGYNKLMRLDYEIQYKKGTKNVVVDSLSRPQRSSHLLSMVLSTISNDVQQRIKDSWINDNEVSALISKLKANPTSAKHYTWIDGLLVRKGKLCVGSNTSLQQDLIEYFHDGTMGGHSGGLPMSKGKSVIMVAMDRLSEYSNFIPLAHPFTTIQVAQAFLDNIYKLYGLPKEWIHWISLAEYRYNTNFQTSINTTPNEVLYGQVPMPHIAYVQGESKVDAIERSLSAMDNVVARISKVAYKLDLPIEGQIHLVFHMSQLKLHKGDVLTIQHNPQLNAERLLADHPDQVLEKKLIKEDSGS
ncbi:retrotransposable element Tf2 [Tanacetum coccineum]